MGFMDALRGEAIPSSGGAKSGTTGGRTVDAITGLQSGNAAGLFATMRRNKINEEGLKADADLIKGLKVAEAERNLHLANIFSTAKQKGSEEQRRVGVAAGANAAIGMESRVSSIIRRKNEYHRQIFNIGKAQDAQDAVAAAASVIAEGIAEHWPKPDPNATKPIYTDDPSVVKFMQDLQAETASTDQYRRRQREGGWQADFDKWRSGEPASEEAAFMAKNREWTPQEKAQSAAKSYVSRTTGGIGGIHKAPAYGYGEGVEKWGPAYGYGEGVEDFESLFLSDTAPSIWRGSGNPLPSVLSPVDYDPNY